jgi:hypothetical protein
LSETELARPDALVVPTELVWRGDQPIITFAEVDRRHLALPFWSHTIERAHRIVGMAPLDALPQAQAPVRPAGFIYHMNRCGSTLAARQLTALPGVFAISEPFVFQQLLDQPDDDADRRVRRLRSLMRAHCTALAPVADRLVIKWSSLMGLHVRQIEAAFPEMPAVFLHRDPVEVLASIAAAPLGGAAYVKPSHLGRHAPDDLDACRAKPLELSARTLANVCDSVADAGGPLALSYDELPSASWRGLAAYFGLDVDGAGRAAMARAAEPHAKHAAGGLPFSGDAWRTTHAADPQVLALAGAFLAPSRARALRRLKPLELSPSRAAAPFDGMTTVV